MVLRFQWDFYVLNILNQSYHLMQLLRPVNPFLETDVAVLPKPLPNEAGVIVIKRAPNIFLFCVLRITPDQRQ